MKPLNTYRYPLMALLCWLLSLPIIAQEQLPSITDELDVPDNEMVFTFYGKPLRAAKLKSSIVKSVHAQDVKQAWLEYENRDVHDVLASLQSLSDELGLNDWFVFELIRNYVDELLCNASPMDRVLMEHFLLVTMGYDVRLARTEKQLLLLVPIEQEVFEHNFIRIGDKDYYLFYDNLEYNENERSIIYPCDPTKDVGKGHALSLSFDGKALNVFNGEDKQCDLDDGQIHIACTMNSTIIQMLRDYPLMDLPRYATSVVLPQFHKTLYDQLEPQIKDLSQCEAVDALLHFVQHVFGYEADGEHLNHDKINFLEENFYYDYNDCEDRSVMFAVLVHSLLGLDVQFVRFPGHECTAVHFTDCLTRGNGYYYGGDFYLICDPTYIGATIGKCMPKYTAMRPEVRKMQTELDPSAYTYQSRTPHIDDQVLHPQLTVNTRSGFLWDLPQTNEAASSTQDVTQPR